MSAMPNLWWTIGGAIFIGFVIKTWFFRTKYYSLSLPVFAVVMAATLGPFVTAFAAKLGERLGEKVPLKQLPWWKRWRHRNELIIEVRGGQSITVELDSQMSDDARLALIDLDVTRRELWGKYLRWDEAQKAWLPVPPRSSGAVV